MRSYAQKQILRELEWQCRSALAVADDLQDALRDRNFTELTGVTRTLVVRIQKISELLWPGDRRLPDRLAEDGGRDMRVRLEVADDSALHRDTIEPLFALLNSEVSGEPPPARPVDGRWCVVQADQCRYDLAPILQEIHRIWGTAADGVGG